MADSKALRTVKAAKEITDVFRLLTNKVDNRTEIMKFMTEIIEAGQGAFMLASVLSKGEYEDALGVCGAAVAGRVASDRVVFSDGSSVAFSVTSLTPLETGEVEEYTEVLGGAE